MGQEMLEFGDAVASAGPCANDLHLTTLTLHHLIFLQTVCFSWHPANSVKAVKV